MLEAMPVADVTLNGLSRKSCMAKSNVLRYFESREAVLLELLSLADRLVSDLEPELRRSRRLGRPRLPREPTASPPSSPGSLAERPVLCDLMSAQASVLEHNISTETVLRYKRNAIVNVH